MAKRVVFAGAGHAQLHSLKRASEFVRRGFEVVTVAPDAFWYSGLATGMLGGLYPPELDCVDVAALVESGGGRFISDRVVGLDLAQRRVELANAPPLRFDALSLTLGSAPPDIPGAQGCAEVYAVKPVRRLWELRLVLEKRFRRGEALRVVIAGGGVTACEIAANVAQLASSLEASVATTVIASGGILKQVPPSAAAKVVRALERRGIAFRADTRVERVETGRAILAGDSAMPFDVLVNATGLAPERLIAELGLPVHRGGALLVDAHLRSIADPSIHGGGDGIAFCGRELPRIGVHAIRQAPVLFHNLLAALEATAPVRFKPQRRFLWIMNLGEGTGLAVRGSLYWHGRAAFRLKDWIDRRFLGEFRQGRGD